MVGEGGDLINMLCSAVLFNGEKMCLANLNMVPIYVCAEKSDCEWQIHFWIKVEKVIKKKKKKKKVGLLKTLLQRPFKIETH